ncbi:MAG: hypothetical protein EOS75_30005 [Mesorhizobium sp.]|nr:MAG: hypothetical protein EOS74_10800 [Mesorhizobium sp.]RWD52214.1 MAG: hypothetical protein EOS75_30005 [Mesorhizobium sp.]
MRIGVLAWGSLVWDRRDLAVAADFKPTGPRLPVEFCRVSGRADQPRRLTLVIDEAVGSVCSTYSAASVFDNLKDARQNLQDREGMDHVNGVGFVDFASGTESHRAMERHPGAVETIKAWAADNGYDAAIWTALACNFHEPDKANEPFTTDAAIRYLETLDEKALEYALTYIRLAPGEVRTPVRAAINKRWPEG